MTRKPTALVSIAEFGRLYGWSRNLAWRKLRRLGHGKWTVRIGRRLFINLSYLRAAHPSLFDAPLAEDLSERLGSVEERLVVVEARSRAHGAALRALAQAMKTI